MKRILPTLSAAFTLLLLVNIFVCFSQASDKSLSRELHAAWRKLERMSDDPDSDRGQWLRLVEKLKKIGRLSRDKDVKSQSRRLAGRAFLALYHRSGRSEDLCLAMRQYRRLNRGRQPGKTALRLRAPPLKTPKEKMGPGGGGITGRAHMAGSKNRVENKAKIPPVVSRTQPMMAPPGGGSCAGNGAAKLTSPLEPDPKIGPICATPPPMSGKPKTTKQTLMVSGRLDRHKQWEERRGRSGGADGSILHPNRAQSCLKTDEPLPLIVIDPGHGGKDPGAVSPDGKVLEKSVTLKIAQFAKSFLLRYQPKVRVRLTRNSDRYLTLSQRASMANDLNADLFLSIHCNASADHSSKGFETYYLSPARTKKAMELAARENGMTLEGLTDLQTTLLDLMVCSKASESRRLAKSVNQNIGALMDTGKANLNRGVKPGPFYVLLGAESPAVLVECGFISNHREGRKLLDKRRLRRIAAGIAKGAMYFLKKRDNRPLIAGNP